MIMDPLHRAKGYPYRIPERSYLLVDGGDVELAAGEPLPDLSDRCPVLASGSNQSPDQLGRKFTALNGDAIPVIRARLADFDTVYSAHFTNYGSVPATLQHAPGTTVTLFVTWLTSDQLTHMHETEARGFNYDFGRLDGIRLMLDDGPVLDAAFAYVSRRGCLTLEGAPISLAATEADGRVWPSLTQEQVLAHVRDLLASGLALNDFIHQLIADEKMRQHRTRAVGLDSLAFSFANFSVLAD